MQYRPQYVVCLTPSKDCQVFGALQCKFPFGSFIAACYDTADKSVVINYSTQCSKIRAQSEINFVISKFTGL